MIRFFQISAILVFWQFTFLAKSSAAAPPPLPIPDEETLGNLRFNLIALLSKSFQFDVDFKWDKRWTLGPSIAFFNTKASVAAGSKFTEDHTISGYGVAIRGNYYPKGVWKTGWYAETSLNYLTV